MPAFEQGGRAMPWKVESVYEQRLAMVHRVVDLRHKVADAAREFGVSRKTVQKWLARFRDKQPGGLSDRSHRPKGSPAKTPDAVEEAVVRERELHNWGPRKIHRVLLDAGLQGVPSVRTVASILSRRGCVPAPPPEPPPPLPLQSFERPAPNDLWQVDHKGPVEVARRKVCPLAVVDDHSRYCLCFEPVADVTMANAWGVLWDVFGRYGLPRSILCDNAFNGPCGGPGLSWFDARLVRLGIDPVHGRPYHPQTQGKVERFNGTAQRELIEFRARRDTLEHFAQDAQQWRTTYNTLRPHEALGDRPPLSRWRPSERPRPDALPEVCYDAGQLTRKVSYAGDFRYRNARILVGRGLAGQTVRIDVRQHDVAVYYAWKQLRVIANDLLGGPRSDKMV
jgi:transposase InsO family protein